MRRPRLGQPGLPLGQPLHAVQVAGGQQRPRPCPAGLVGQVLVVEVGGQAVQLGRGGHGGARPVGPQGAVPGVLLVGQDGHQGPGVAE
ncbi:MAG: hypothetical protein ACJ77H_03780, partial [Actinomycetota bacterium]